MKTAAPQQLFRSVVVPLVILIGMSANALAQTCSASDFIVQYSAFIPVDHVSGPSNCPDVLNTLEEPFIPLIYKGDAFRGTYRVTESIRISTVTQQSTGFFRDAGETRNYDAVNSPVNHVTLSASPFGSQFPKGDEDGAPHDCFLWNASGFDDASNYHQGTTVTASGGVVHFSGIGRNPLDAPVGGITWDITITINAGQLTASVDFDHTCYPVHQVKVNGRPIYVSGVAGNNVVDIVGCLTGLLPHASGSTGPQPIPAY